VVIFGGIVENNSFSRGFFKDIEKNLNVSDVTRNPFKDYKVVFKPVFELGFKDPLVFVCNLNPVYPKFYYFGLLWVFIIFFFKGFTFTFWYIPPVIIVLIGYFAFSKKFFFMAFKKGLLKKGYNDTLLFLNNEDLFKRWLE